MPVADLRRLEREVRRLTYELDVAGRQVPHLRALVEGTSDLLALLDEDGVVVEHNRAFAQAMDPTADELAGVDVRGLFYRDGACTESLLSTREFAKIEGPARVHGFAKPGRAIEIDLDWTTLCDRRLVVLAARLLDTESQEARELHEARLQVQELAERLSQERRQERIARHESLSVLAGTLAHDMNNAFAIVYGNLEALRNSTDDPLHLSLISDIFDGAHAARELLERLRSFGRGAQPILSRLHLQPWIQAMVRQVARSSGSVIGLSLPEAPAWVHADEMQLTQVLINLLTNALEASGDVAEIELRLEPTRGASPGWELEVLDRGPGIPGPSLAKLFEPFYTTKATGSGLGLASSRRIVQAHRGWIDAHNRPSGGARLRVWLPAAVNGHPPELSHVQILLVQVQGRVQDALVHTLHSLDANVHTAADASEALSKYRRLCSSTAQPIAILDLSADDASAGLQMLARLQDLDRSVSALALVPRTDRDLSESYRKLGFRAHVTLPCDPPELVAAILAC